MPRLLPTVLLLLLLLLLLLTVFSPTPVPSLFRRALETNYADNQVLIQPRVQRRAFCPSPADTAPAISKRALVGGKTEELEET